MTWPTTDIRFALEAIYGGDQTVEASCLTDKLEDLGWVGLRAQVIAGEVPLLFPEASTRGLPKMVHP